MNLYVQVSHFFFLHYLALYRLQVLKQMTFLKNAINIASASAIGNATVVCNLELDLKNF